MRRIETDFVRHFLFLMHILPNAVLRISCLINAPRRLTGKTSIFGDFNSKISLKSLSACSDTSASQVISHDSCEYQQKLFLHFLFDQPAYPFSNSTLNSASDNVLTSTGLADGIFTSKGSTLCKIICLWLLKNH